MNRSILFFGSQCTFADVVLRRLIDQRFSVAARFVPGVHDSARPYREIVPPAQRAGSKGLPVLQSHGSASVVPEPAAFPTFQLNRQTAAQSLDLVTSLEADIAVVCCYPQRIHEKLLDRVNRGALNIHPSLLPRYRGPEPLFWLYRDGQLETGVTVHSVAPTLDSGPIVARRSLDLALGKPGDELWMESASIGADLLVQALHSGAPSRGPMISQEEALASYYSWPTQSDLLIDAHRWHAWRVYHFVRGIAPLGYVPVVHSESYSLPVYWAVDYVDDRGRGPVEPASFGQKWVDCSDGRVLLQIARTSAI